jgi:hypothetical protein
MSYNLILWKAAAAEEHQGCTKHSGAAETQSREKKNKIKKMAFCDGYS